MSRFREFLWGLTLACLAGCSTFELEGSGSISPSTITGRETVHGSLYGYRWQQFQVEKCEQDSLFRIEFHTNALLLLTSLVTLGLYVPQTVEWWCNTQVAPDEEEEVWIPPSKLSQALKP